MGSELKPSTPKMNKGVSMMLKNLLGIEPEELFAHFAETIQMMKDFCAHFDRRMVEVAKQTSELSDKIAALEKALQEHAIKTQPSEEPSANGHDKSADHPDATDNADIGRSDQIA